MGHTPVRTYVGTTQEDEPQPKNEGRGRGGGKEMGKADSPNVFFFFLPSFRILTPSQQGEKEGGEGISVQVPRGETRRSGKSIGFFFWREN